MAAAAVTSGCTQALQGEQPVAVPRCFSGCNQTLQAASRGAQQQVQADQAEQQLLQAAAAVGAAGVAAASSVLTLDFIMIFKVSLTLS